MVVIERERIKNIPILHVVKQSSADEKLPAVLFVHGFTSAKEHNLHYAYLLAEKGFRVIMPDAFLHGEREAGIGEKELMLSFWKIIVKTIHELEDLKDVFLERGLIDEARIGIAGTSMGGIVTLGALTVHKWISAGVSLMGNPAYVDFARMQIEYLRRSESEITLSEEEIEMQLTHIRDYDLSLQPEKLAGRPVMFWHGAKDSVVPYQAAYELYQSLMPVYENSLDSIQFILDENAGHKVSREGILRTADWFEKHLGSHNCLIG